MGHNKIGSALNFCQTLWAWLWLPLAAAGLALFAFAVVLSSGWREARRLCRYLLQI